MPEVTIPFTRSQDLVLRLPGTWRVIANAVPVSPPPLGDLAQAILTALNAPIGFPPLEHAVGPDTRILLVLDDPSRPMPVSGVAPVVLSYLLEAGARVSTVVCAFALGTHEPLSPDQMRERAGREVCSTIRCTCVDCHESQSFTELGTTMRGTVVRLARLAVEADLRILIGTIEPHPQAGFGGGLKNLLPRLAHAQTIGQNYLIVGAGEREVAILPHGGAGFPLVGEREVS